MTTSLDERIADAFASELGSADLGSLLSEVRAAGADARELTERSNRTALHPATRPAAVADARKIAEDATFRATRYDKAIEGLTRLLTEARARERRESDAVEFAAARAERDELVKDIREQYPDLSGRLVALLSRIEASNSRIEAANRLGIGTIARAETDARPTAQDLHNLPVRQLVDHVRLPHFDMIHARPDQWPPHSRW